MVASAYVSGAEQGVTALDDGLEELEKAVNGHYGIQKQRFRRFEKAVRRRKKNSRIF